MESIVDLLRFDPGQLPANAEKLRQDVREFLAVEMKQYSALKRAYTWDGADQAFSEKMGAKGWLGMTLPKEYGGAGLSNLERYVVAEETLFAGAPVGFHWIADRQSGPLIARIGTEKQKAELLPRICRGEICFSIGMSEPNSGSDLASLQAKAVRTDEGWLINGTKLWTTNAHIASYMIGLFRTDLDAKPKHAGLSQFIIDLKNTPGVTVRPIEDLTGRKHFNEVVFEDALVPHDALLGTENDGWQQVGSELAIERSGPERFLSCAVLFTELLKVLEQSGDQSAKREIGSILANLVTLRSMSLSVSAKLAQFEQTLPGIVQKIVSIEPNLSDDAEPLAQVLALLTMLAPSFSLRGGTVEILRGIIAKRLGVS
jgi:alkylation response protein AidB-like acyl-CoA dehydrogenase